MTISSGGMVSIRSCSRSQTTIGSPARLDSRRASWTPYLIRSAISSGVAVRRSRGSCPFSLMTSLPSDVGPEFLIVDSRVPSEESRGHDAMTFLLSIFVDFPEVGQGKIELEQVPQPGLVPPTDRPFGDVMASLADPLRDAPDREVRPGRPD